MVEVLTSRSNSMLDRTEINVVCLAKGGGVALSTVRDWKTRGVTQLGHDSLLVYADGVLTFKTPRSERDLVFSSTLFCNVQVMWAMDGESYDKSKPGFPSMAEWLRH